MLPTITSWDIEEGIRSFIEREFAISTLSFQKGHDETVVTEFLNDKDNYLKGPWLEIKRPFKRQKQDLTQWLPEYAGRYDQLRFEPYLHQLKAFERLSANDPKSTIIATGTASGKTECFMVPILDWVLRTKHQGMKGIKAIIIYPMNALATDQSKRFAQKVDTLVKQAHSAGITVGLYTGSPGSESRVMSAQSVITRRQTLRETPPDILLTNYKMLDYLLLRQSDRALWAGTTAQSLRYLVVDELHTFDGAQGTDLACLIRRLKDFLNVGDDLVCVGTSATLGGEEAIDSLRHYACDIFGSNFTDPEAIIVEERLTKQEYLTSLGDKNYKYQWPKAGKISQIQSYRDPAKYNEFIRHSVEMFFGRMPSGVTLKTGSRAWQDLAIYLGKELPKHEAFRRLMSQGDELLHLETLASEWKQSVAELSRVPVQNILSLLRALVALISLARVEVTLADGTTRLQPFLSIRVQLWVRELRGLLSNVSTDPQLVLGAHQRNEDALALPLVTCRTCNATAWGAVQKGDEIDIEPHSFYELWFNDYDTRATLMYPIQAHEFTALQKRYPKELKRFCPAKRVLKWIQPDAKVDDVYAAHCPICDCEHDPIICRVPDIHETKKRSAGSYRRLTRACSWCGSKSSFVLGARSQTLASLVNSHLNSSQANQNHKLISFSDSVQDAALHAGFMEARSYQYAVRQAIAGYIRTNSNTQFTLEEFLENFENYCLEKVGRRQELLKERHLSDEQIRNIECARFISTFIAPNMQWMYAWQQFTRQLDQIQTQLDPNDPKGHLNKIYQALPSMVTEPDQSNLWANLYRDVARRLRFELFSEMTFRANFGRTVESMGIGTLSINPDQFNDAFDSFEDSLTKADDELSKLVEDSEGKGFKERLKIFMLGVLERFKELGAVDIRQMDEGYDGFANYVNTGSLYALSADHALPDYGLNFVIPHPVILSSSLKESAQKSGQTITSDESYRSTQEYEVILPTHFAKSTWFTNWAKRCFSHNVNLTNYLDVIFKKLLIVLEDFYIIRRVTTPTKMEVYLLDPHNLVVNTDLQKATCTQCGRSHRIWVNDERDVQLWESMPCLSVYCDSTSHTVSKVRTDHAIYSGVPVRTIAREHTANVEDSVRAQIERSFMNGTDAWNVNLLSATPTLEMGIDIENLSSVLLTSMPPNVANYVQRIGRAGRQDGNALALTICGQDPHAQYFWASPEKMLNGYVEPPGVFLHALDVIERQLFAFAVTNWMSDVPGAHIPKEIRQVLLQPEASEKGYEASSFPLGLLDYIHNHADSLLARFVAQFKTYNPQTQQVEPIYSAQEQKRLRDFLVGDGAVKSAQSHLMGRLRRLQDELRRYRNRIQEYEKSLEFLRSRPQDEATVNTISEVQANIHELRRMISRELENKHTLNVLTDEGVLPNYAFPEEGITLDSVVVKRRSGSQRDRATLTYAKAQAKEDAQEKLDLKGGESKTTAPQPVGESSRNKPNVYKRFTLQRAASSGLFELAPNSSFYSNDYILHIEQLDLGNDQVHTWRFCERCHYSDLDTLGHQASACPRCGDPAWQDVAQKRPVLELKTVYGWADIRKDRIKDDFEKRIRKSHSSIKLMDVGSGCDRKRYSVKGTDGFGFEYFSNVTIKDFNFGEEGTQSDTNELRVASTKRNAPGYCVCKFCGYLKKEQRSNQKYDGSQGRHVHDINCPCFKDTRVKEEWIDGLILYRAFKTEALRIRVPQGWSTEAYTPEVVAESLRAAIQTGLKLYFHGNVQHLDWMIMRESVGNGATEVVYLVIYDTVPGGTGYLKELLSDAQRMMLLLKQAHAHLNACTCNLDPEADGCYRCVYQYRNQRHRSAISRSCAQSILMQLIAHQGDVTEENVDLPTIDDEYDSELERLFMVALRQDQTFIQSVVPIARSQSGQKEYLVTMRVPQDEDVARVHPRDSGFVWRVRFQKPCLNTVPSKPDFFIEPYREEDQNEHLKMAVFLDGWRYHSGIVATDLRKRQAIVNQGQHVWTLMWDDVLAYVKESTRGHTEVGHSYQRSMGIDFLSKDLRIDETYNKYVAAFGLLEEKALNQQMRNLPESSLHRLLAWMQAPEAMMLLSKSYSYYTYFGLSWAYKDGRQRRQAIDAITQCQQQAKPCYYLLAHDDRHQYSQEQAQSWWQCWMGTVNPLHWVYGVDAASFLDKKDFPSSKPEVSSLRYFWAHMSFMSLSSRVILLPTLDVENTTDLTPLLQMAVYQESLSMLASALPLEALQPEPIQTGTDDKARYARWAVAKEMLDDSILELVDRLASEGVDVDVDNVGLDWVQDSKGVVGTLEVVWPAAKVAIALAPTFTGVAMQVGDFTYVNGHASLDDAHSVLMEKLSAFRAQRADV